jgi:hypothetical protein
LPSDATRFHERHRYAGLTKHVGGRNPHDARADDDHLWLL